MRQLHWLNPCRFAPSTRAVGPFERRGDRLWNWSERRSGERSLPWCVPSCGSGLAIEAGPSGTEAVGLVAVVWSRWSRSGGARSAVRVSYLQRPPWRMRAGSDGRRAAAGARPGREGARAMVRSTPRLIAQAVRARARTAATGTTAAVPPTRDLPRPPAASRGLPRPPDGRTKRGSMVQGGPPTAPTPPRPRRSFGVRTVSPSFLPSRSVRSIFELFLVPVWSTPRGEDYRAREAVPRNQKKNGGTVVSSSAWAAGTARGREPGSRPPFARAPWPRGPPAANRCATWPG